MHIFLDILLTLASGSAGWWLRGWWERNGVADPPLPVSTPTLSSLGEAATQSAVEMRLYGTDGTLHAVRTTFVPLDAAPPTLYRPHGRHVTCYDLESVADHIATYRTKA